MYLLESPQRGDSNKHIKRMIHKKNCSKVSVIHALKRIHTKFLYNSKFDLTSKSLITNEGPLYILALRNRIACMFFFLAETISLYVYILFV